MGKIKDMLVLKLLFCVGLGLFLGSFASPTIISVVVVIKDVLAQLLFFTVPLIILAFIAPSILTLKAKASKMLTFSICIAYLSTLGASIFSMFLGYLLVPRLSISSVFHSLTPVPDSIFTLQITPIMSVMSALVLSVMLGLGVCATKSEHFENLLKEFQNIVLSIINSFILPIIPFFIGSTFMILSFEGAFDFSVFLTAILIVLVAHFVWLLVIYAISFVYSKENPLNVLKHYAPAYFTAIGTMSSAVTLPVALKCAKKSNVLSKESVDFGIPLFANIHLCGSVLTEVFFVMLVSKILYGALPELSQMLIFIVLLGIFGIGAPGVPGGTVMASLGLITSVLGFDTDGTALMMTIFALQDSFGTACNVTGDGALALILTKYSKEKL